ncbi:MAG: ureidoglycolate lyase, partial [Pusillimonas sp.]
MSALLKLEPLTKAAFAPFGDVIATDNNDWFPINNGTTRRYHNIGQVQV